MIDSTQVKSVNTVVFDLGGVLIDWNPRYLFQKLFEDKKDMEYFLENICTMEWNIEQDAGRPFGEAVNILTNQYPEYQELISAFDLRWEEMLGDALPHTVKLLKQLKDSETSIYALTNWSHEKFPIALQRFDFLHWFEGIIVSGEVKLKKPDLAIYEHLLNKYQLEASKTLFIDDNKDNVEAAKQIGMQGVHFKDPHQLESELQLLGIL